MKSSSGLLRIFLFLSFTYLFTGLILARDKRAMTLEDVMNFHHMQSPAINYDGKWIAYVSSPPDRGDGYGVLVSVDRKREYRVDRGEDPRFSPRGNWVLFNKKPPFLKMEGKPASERPKDAAILIKTSDGSRNIYPDMKSASFSTAGEFLFIHQHNIEDTTLTKEQNEKLHKAGSPLVVKDLVNQQQRILSFVESWTVDSLSTTLVFTIKDTLDGNNGLYYLSLEDIFSLPRAIDKTKGARYGSFTWHEKDSRLAYTRAEDKLRYTAETAVLYSWQIDRPVPELLLKQDDAPCGYFLPFDNRLTWSNDGQRLFFGLRPDRFAAKPPARETYESVLDSIRQQAEVDIWHWNDPFIKTHEKHLWNLARRQNLVSVFHIEDKRIVQLADEKITNVQPSLNGDFAMAFTMVSHSDNHHPPPTDFYIVNLHTGERKLVASELGWYRSSLGDLASLSPKGDYFLYFKNEHWHVYDMTTGKYRNLTENIDVPFYDEGYDRTHPDRLRLGADNEDQKYISYHPSMPSGYRVAGWMEDGETVLICDQYDTWQANLRTGIMLNITAGEGRKSQTIFRIRKIDDEPFFKNSEEVLIEGFNDNTKVRAIYSARLDRQGVTLLKDEGKKLRLRLLSGDKKTIVYTRESYNEFPDLWVTDARFKNPVRVSNLNEQVEKFNWGTSELISYWSADGIPLQGVVIKPGDYDPSKKYPVLVCFYEYFSHRLHDFDQTSIVDNPSFGLSSYFASNGYVLFLPDIHYKEGRPGMSAVKSLVGGVQKLIHEGIADPDAIGLHGHSFSGYQAAYVVTQTDIFKAVIAGAPVCNVTSSYGSIRTAKGRTQQFLYETGQGRLNATIFERRDLYIENSPLFYANEINTPLLLMHSDTDLVVPWEQSIEMYLAMRRIGKDVIFLQYGNEPHHLLKFHNRVDYAIRMKEYLDYHLKGYEPADWIVNGVPYMGK